MRQVLDSDFKGHSLNLASYSNVQNDLDFNCPNILPLNIKSFLDIIKNESLYKGIGTNLYMEFKIKNHPPENKILKNMNQPYFISWFMFKINVNTQFIVGLCS